MARPVSHQKLMRSYSPDFVAICARGGRRIPHTHIFVVSTYRGDVLDRFFNALEEFQERASDLAGLKGEAKLAEAADRLKGA
ncbi:hypothetical protein [Candidatus Methanocrinis natronophilus]|uniref:Uncharacterized protein n=1 Tax=Candidatus Methanocrinis natronophilus TaxID=3033396 RepID=A0ABT5X6E9_9EURY|nr:hypothetical protein [Candidatus Methanocrinis natronophilus]MDF0590281.1 hypothetical protein [Candidatus Methanocrinis natronophilus]